MGDAADELIASISNLVRISQTTNDDADYDSVHVHAL